MFSANSIKIFSPLVLALSICSCGWRQTPGESTATPAPFAAEPTKSGVPFQTREPENFQFDLIVTMGGGETKTFTARRDGNYRLDYNAGGNLLISAVDTADGKSFLILDAEKIYAETSAAESTTRRASSGSPDFLINEWLSAKTDARFTNLGTENGLTRYGVNLGDGSGDETIVFVDENINLPVRQEFYSINGEERSRTFAVEMRNFKLLVDAGLFEIPAGYKKVSPQNLRAVIRRKSSGS